MPIIAKEIWGKHHKSNSLYGLLHKSCLKQKPLLTIQFLCRAATNQEFTNQVTIRIHLVSFKLSFIYPQLSPAKSKPDDTSSAKPDDSSSAVSADTNIDDGNTWDGDNSWSGDDSQDYSDDTNAWDGNDDADNAGTDQWTNENGNTDWGYDNGGDQGYTDNGYADNGYVDDQTNTDW